MAAVQRVAMKLSSKGKKCLVFGVTLAGLWTVWALFSELPR